MLCHVSSRRTGYTLVEMIIYVAVLSLLSSVLFASVMMVIQSFTRARAVRDLAESGRGTMERITREVRRATAINDAGSVFANPAGQLQLSTTNEAGGATTLTLAKNGDDLTIQEGTGSPINLLSGQVAVNGLTFHKWATSTASAIRIDLALTDDRLPGVEPVMFHTTVVLRGSY